MRIVNSLNVEQCPDCDAYGFDYKPRVGISRNIFCKVCDQGFNVSPDPSKVFFVQRMAADRARDIRDDLPRARISPFIKKLSERVVANRWRRLLWSRLRPQPLWRIDVEMLGKTGWQQSHLAQPRCLPAYRRAQAVQPFANFRSRIGRPPRNKFAKFLRRSSGT